MNTMKNMLCLLLLALIPISSAAEKASPPRFTDPDRRAKLEAALPEVEKVFRAFYAERGVPGLVFGVVIDNDVVMIRSFGVQDVVSRAPVKPETVFRIASMTKSFTALCILRLRDEGKLSLDDPASRWIPELAQSEYLARDAPPISVRHLLTHGAGFPEDNPWGDRQLSTTEDMFTRRLKLGLPFSTPPDTEYEYSNYGFALLGRIVSRASGMSYSDYLSKRILGPLGMQATTLYPEKIPRELRATGYRRTQDGYVAEPSLPHGAFGAMGGLQTSALDLGKYVALQLSAFPPRDDREEGPVRRSSLREMQHPWRPVSLTAGRPAPDEVFNVTADAYGYGLRIRRDCRFERSVGHGGGLPGFGSYMAWLPDYGVGIFAMANLTYAGPARAINEAFDVLLKTGALQPRRLPPSPILRSTREGIVRLWDKWDERQAAALAADNLFQDMPAAERRSQIDRIKNTLGACRPEGEIEPENSLRGKFRLACQRGSVDVRFTLAPTMPPKVQFLIFSPTGTLQEPMEKALEALARLIGSPATEFSGALAGGSFDSARLRRQVEALGVSYGTCKPAESLGGDGRTEAQVRFECERGSLQVQLRLDESGKISSISFAKPPWLPCLP